jgi:hypothetical protein
MTTITSPHRTFRVQRQLARRLNPAKAVTGDQRGTVWAHRERWPARARRRPPHGPERYGPKRSSRAHLSEAADHECSPRGSPVDHRCGEPEERAKLTRVAKSTARLKRRPSSKPTKAIDRRQGRYRPRLLGNYRPGDAGNHHDDRRPDYAGVRGLARRIRVLSRRAAIGLPSRLAENRWLGCPISGS